MASARTSTHAVAETGEHALSSASDAAETVATSRWLARVARVGLTARGLIYLVLGVLSIQLASGHATNEIDQNGAFRTIRRQPYGPAVLWLLVVGFASYALWRATEVVYGEVGGGRGVKERVTSGFRTLVYIALCVTALSVVRAGDTSRGSAQQDESASAGLMQHTWGRALVGLVGLVIAIVGVVLVYEGWRKKFTRYLRIGDMSEMVRRVVVSLGRYGTIARGVVFGIVGVLTFIAALRHQPTKARGIDEAVQTMAHTPGAWLLWVVAIGLLAFGVYGLAEALWRQTKRPERVD
jgi:hypothetical protein